MFNIISVKKKLFPETSLWASRVIAAGGGFETNSVPIANNLVRQIKNSSFGGKMVYLLPMLGRGIGAARVPLIDALNVGAATNTNFVDADFSQATGLQGNGSSKILSTLIKPSQLGISNSGGIGYYENNLSLAGSGVQPMGCYATSNGNRFVLDVRAGFSAGRWGDPANDFYELAAPFNSDWYAQRSSATDRRFWLNGIEGNNSPDAPVSDAATGANDLAIRVLGADEGPGGITYWAGRCALAYMTDGTLTGTEVAALDTMLRQYLMGPTGKPQT